MYYSIRFDALSIFDNSVIGTYNTHDDWFLVPTSRPVIKLPSQKTNYVEIPGVSGKLDLTYALVKYPIYDNRSGSIDFAVLNEHPGYTWHDIFNMISRAINGRRSRAYLEDDPDYYYEGYWYLDEWKSNNNRTWSEVTINYNIDPYKYYKLDKTFTKLSSQGSKSITFTSNDIGSMPVVPTITVTGTDNNGITISCSNSEFGITDLVKEIPSDGVYNFYDIVLSMLSSSNVCTLNIFGAGQVTVDFRKGEL